MNLKNINKNMTNPSFGKGINIDVAELLVSRMLIQANSGGGKSWACRRLLEQTATSVQQMIIDSEGEFASLREKHDYIIATANGGDALAHPRTAALLARRLLETGVSCICDISELKAHERATFIRLFFDSMINAPRRLWRPVLVLLDEADKWAPQKSKAESTASVIDMACRGRKRGFCLVAATQRIAKFNNDVAAECVNKIIGRTGLECDVKRAAEELGMTKKEAWPILRTLKPGEFFCFGPALSESVTRFKVGPVKTTHPEPGSAASFKPPAPSAKVKKVLAKLSDLPKEAEHEATTSAELKSENTRLKRELTAAKRTSGTPEAEIKKRIQIAVDQASRELSDKHRATTDILLSKVSEKFKELLDYIKSTKQKNTTRKSSVAATPRTGKVIVTESSKISSVGGGGNGGASQAINISKCARTIMGVLANYPEGCSMNKISLLAGYRQSGGFRNTLSELRSANIIIGGNKEIMRLTELGHSLGPFDPLPTPGTELAAYWLNNPRLSKCAKKILQSLLDNPNGLGIDAVSEITGYAKSGGFRNSFSELRTAGLISGGNQETMTANPDLL